MAGLLVLGFPFLLLGFMLFMGRVEEPLSRVATERKIEAFLEQADPSEIDTFVHQGTDSALRRFTARLRVTAPARSPTRHLSGHLLSRTALALPGPGVGRRAVRPGPSSARDVDALDSRNTAEPHFSTVAQRSGGAVVDEVLARAGLFQGVDPEAAEALAGEFEFVDTPRGTVLFSEGDPGDSLYIVVSGKVKLGRRSSDGRENLVAVMGPSDQFGELSLFDPGPRTATAVAVTDTRVAVLPKEALVQWVSERPQIALQLMRVIARRLRRTNTMLADLIFVDVPGRVAKQLLQLAAAVRFGRRRPAAGHPRPDPGRAGPAGRRLPRDRQQGPGRLRLPGLAAPGGQERRHPRPRTPVPPRALRARQTVPRSAGDPSRWVTS